MKMLLRTLLLAGVSLTAVAAWAQAAPPAAQAVTPKQVASIEAKLADWPQLDYYRAANAALPAATAGQDRVVFFGASVAEFWGKRGGQFFPGKPYINRGIGGQTSAQMVVRFRQDVINLHPVAVVFLESTNDISQEMEPEMSEDNWQSIAELAKANGIRMILTSITPSSHFPWNPGLHPAETIRTRNAWLKEYAASHLLTYVDFDPVLANAEGGMKAELTVDGVHPNKEGYVAMAPLVQAAIDKTLAVK